MQVALALMSLLAISWELTPKKDWCATAEAQKQSTIDSTQGVGKNVGNNKSLTIMEASDRMQGLMQVFRLGVFGQWDKSKKALDKMWKSTKCFTKSLW